MSHWHTIAAAGIAFKVSQDGEPPEDNNGGGDSNNGDDNWGFYVVMAVLAGLFIAGVVVAYDLLKR